MDVSSSFIVYSSLFSIVFSFNVFLLEFIRVTDELCPNKVLFIILVLFELFSMIFPYNDEFSIVMLFVFISMFWAMMFVMFEFSDPLIKVMFEYAYSGPFIL